MTRPALIVTALAVLAWLATIVALVFALTQPVEANPRVEPLRYTTNWPTECRRWIDLPRAHEHGGVIREWAERVARWKQDGTCVRVTRRANSAALLVLELHTLGHLCIAPDARLGFHTSESADWFEPLFRRFPGLWAWYAAGPMHETRVTYVSGAWFNDRGVPTCEVR